MSVLTLQGKVLVFLFQQLRLVLLYDKLLSIQLVVQVINSLFLLFERLLRFTLLIHHLPDQHSQSIDLFPQRDPSIIIKQLVDPHYPLILPFGPVDL